MVAPAVTDDAEEDEESMDWWTKYFASIDTMIEVSCGMITKTMFIFCHQFFLFLQACFLDKFD